MKKFIPAILALVICIFTLSGCETQSGGTNGSEDASGKLSVVTTIFAPYDFTRAITGENADVTMLLPPASESHSFEPTPQDIIKIQNCDVFIYAGGESDEWVNGILSSMDTSGMQIITLMDCVEVVEEELVEGMQDDGHEHGEEGHDEEHDGEEEHDEEHNGEEEHDEEHEVVYDEHVWTSPRNAKLIVQKISGVICEADAENSALYRQNTDEYLVKLDELDRKFNEALDGATRKTIVFGDRFPFRYFTDAYGLDYFAAFPGCSTETEPSAKTVSFLIDKVKNEEIPVVFHIELSNKKMADTISEATGAKVMLLHACHNISKDDFESGKTYMDLMNANADALKEALK